MRPSEREHRERVRALVKVFHNPRLESSWILTSSMREDLRRALKSTRTGDKMRAKIVAILLHNPETS